MSLVKVSQARGRVPVTIFHLQGRVNLGNTSELERAAKDAYAIGMRDLVIDLSEAPSLTSAGIRAVMIVHKLLSGENAKSSRHLKLVSPTEYVRNVLEIAGLLDYLEVYKTLEEAISSF
ncbi:MAG: STAS domain-containing protein [Anaerolineales bacterium]|nr:STAS domain-containing protein [Anaerolineales bacterium]